MNERSLSAVDELIQKYEQLKPCDNITYYPNAIEFKLSSLDGWLIEKRTLDIMHCWGRVELAQVAQSQEYLRIQKELQNLGILR